MRHRELLHGIAAALLANVNRKKDAEPYQPTDFMPSWQEPEMTWEEIKRNVESWRSINDGGSCET